MVGAVASTLGLLATGGSDYHGDSSRTPRRTQSLNVPRRRTVAATSIARRTRTCPGDDPAASRACPCSTSTARRRAAAARDAERRPPRRVPPRGAGLPTLPRLDARLPDEPQRLRGDGRAAARRGLRRGAVDGGGGPRRDQHLRDPRGGRAEGHRPAGAARAAQGGEPGDARRHDRLRGPRAGPGRAPQAVPGGRPVPPARRGARARRPARARVGAGRRSGSCRGATTVVGRTLVGAADHLPGTRAGAVASGAVRRESATSRLAADHLRLRQDLHLLHRAVQPRPGAQPAVRRDRRRGPLARRRRLPRGHAARPERQLVRPRPAAGAALRRRRHRPLGGPPPRPPRPARPRGADPGDRRDPDRRRRAGDPAPAVRDVASVGPQRPADRGDGRVPVGLRAPPPAGPVRRRRDAPADGPPVHDRALPRAAGPDPRGGARDRDLDRRDRRVLRRDRGPVPGDAPAPRDRPLRHGLRRGVQRAARDARDAARRRRPVGREAPPPERAARAPGGDRARAEPGLGGPPGRGARRRRDAAALARPRRRRSGAPAGPAGAMVSGRTRQNKLVHLAGGPELVGRLVTARVEHAGAYSLRGMPA